MIDPYQPLILTNDTQTILRLLNEGVCTMTGEGVRSSTLHRAAVSKNALSLCEIFLKYGCTPNDFDEKKVSVLYDACWNIEARGLVPLFLKYGADPDILNPGGYPSMCTATHVAAERGFLDALNALVFHQADLGKKDSYGFTPLERCLFSACKQYHELNKFPSDIEVFSRLLSDLNNTLYSAHVLLGCGAPFKRLPCQARDVKSFFIAHGWVSFFSLA